MSTTATTRVLASAAAEVKAALPRSVSRFEEISHVIPGGTSRHRFWWPMPVYVDHGEGGYVYDIDGRRYLDCNLGFGPLILGHRHPRVLAALEKQLSQGLLFGAASIGEGELAKQIVSNVPGAEEIIFVNSGTEATLAALRVARAITGRNKIAKFEGGWHGWHDFVFHSFSSIAGDPDSALTMPDTLGVADSVMGSVVVLPFNDPSAFIRMRKEASDLACVIIEGVQGGGGVLPADPSFMKELRAVCDELGVLLIRDEVITGFRLGTAGAAGLYGVQADLTTLGKVIGGGLAIGALCGPAELMQRVVPDVDGKSVVVAGTFSANPMTMAAGHAQLGLLIEDPNQYVRLNNLGERVRSGITSALDEVGVTGHVTGVGSIWGIHFTPSEPHNVRDQRAANHDTNRILAAYLLLEGVLTSSPVHLSFLSTAHTEDDVDEVVAAHVRALSRMKKEACFD